MNRKRRIFNLWTKSRFCYWCGRPTVLIYRPPELEKKITVRPDEATLDHLHDRNQFRDGRPQCAWGVETTVLACSECNHRRGREACAATPIEELWERSGSYPQGHPKAKPDQRRLRGGLES